MSPDVRGRQTTSLTVLLPPFPPHLGEKGWITRSKTILHGNHHRLRADKGRKRILCPSQPCTR